MNDDTGGIKKYEDDNRSHAPHRRRNQHAATLRDDGIGPVHPMTLRELEVLSWVAEGYSNKLIGAQLAISERTVRNHLTSIMNKLSVFDRTHAVVTAVRHGSLSI